MHFYRWLNIIAGCVISLLAAGMVMGGITDGNWLCVAIPVAVAALWWYAFYRLEKGSITLSFILNVLACCGMLYTLNARRQFVVRNGGWERADGAGSPLAFLIGLVFDIFWFLFFFMLTMRGLSLILRREKAQPAGERSVPVEDA